MSQLVRDVRFALRSMAKSPGVSLLMVGTLAVGLAANGIIFNVLDAMVLRPFAYPNTSRLVRLWETGPGTDDIDRENVSAANLLDWQAQAKGALAELIAIDEWETSLRTDGASEHVELAAVSAGFWEALGVAPAAGRAFLPEEAQKGQDRRLILSDALWRRSFGGQPHGQRPDHEEADPGTLRHRAERKPYVADELGHRGTSSCRWDSMEGTEP